MENTLELIKSLNINDEYVVVACSGGPDSMFLLNLLNKLGIKCVCAHVNHKVRISSDDEYKFLEAFCNNNGIIFEGTELKEKYETNFEFHARNFRYNYFESIIKINSDFTSRYLLSNDMFVRVGEEIEPSKVEYKKVFKNEPNSFVKRLINGNKMRSR